jgi:hypothetical protein
VCEGIRPPFFGLFLTARILISRSQALSNSRARLGGPRLPELRRLRIGRSASGLVGPGVTGSAVAATSWPMAGYLSGSMAPSTTVRSLPSPMPPSGLVLPPWHRQASGRLTHRRSLTSSLRAVWRLPVDYRNTIGACRSGSLSLEVPDEPVGDSEDRTVARQSARNRFAAPMRFRLRRSELVVGTSRNVIQKTVGAG